MPNAATAYRDDGTLASAALQAKLVELVTVLAATSRAVKQGLARLAAAT